MIPDSAGAAMHDTASAPDWKQSLAQAITDPTVLLQRLQIKANPEVLAAADRAAKTFKLRVTESFADRMRLGDLNDPLLRQVLPIAEELLQAKGYSADPVGDLDVMTAPGLLQKYKGRALLVSTGACAIHCRYCFRREFPYSQANPKRDQWQSALAQVSTDTSIHELILSGGDPLMLGNKALSTLLEHCSQINHLKRVRIHSRLPVVLPERIDSELCELFNKIPLQIVHVIHCNHAQEIDNSVALAVARLRECSSLILNQAVLLKGVNDSSDAQIALAEKLTEINVLPYYLHLLDRVHGTHHFEVTADQAVILLNKVKEALPGYMVPKLVQEIPGKAAKEPVFEHFNFIGDTSRACNAQKPDGTTLTSKHTTEIRVLADHAKN